MLYADPQQASQQLNIQDVTLEHLLLVKAINLFIFSQSVKKKKRLKMKSEKIYQKLKVLFCLSGFFSVYFIVLEIFSLVSLFVLKV